jgi:hypothetical protein
VKERPILFSGPMVRALLAGTKTQTRRPVKTSLPPSEYEIVYHPGNGHALETFGDPHADGFERRFCPYGVPGDRLWVRETFAFTGCGPDDRGAMDWGAHNIRGGDWEGERGCERWHVAYRASGDDPPAAGDHPGWRPSIHMPRWASRITLEITEMRVQRLQDISGDDANAEGVEHVAAFARLWNSINGPGAWDANPWVWALTFKRVEVQP